MGQASNVIVAQSGGPTPVINNSLRGVIETCRKHPDLFGAIYGGWHGVEGILNEQLVDLSAQSEEEISLLRTTPTAGFIGTCRYKLKNDKPEDFDRIIDVMKAHDVGYFFYIGGNDSMDTAHKISKLAHERGLDLITAGVPKTIDNDIGDAEFKLIDHTPGYGSVAKYWAHQVQCANEENMGSCPADPVLVMQAMGRKIGFIPAAARLADPRREMPLQIYLSEAKLSLEELAERVNDLLKQAGRAVVVVGEGIDIGDIGQTKDSFGHVQFSASDTTAAQAVVSYLNRVGLKAAGKARGQVSGTDQRMNILSASVVDLDEAYLLGAKAVEIAMKDGNGYMSTLVRQPGEQYAVAYGKADLMLVANSERFFPQRWLSPSKCDVTDDFIQYATPLIGGDFVSVPIIGGLMRFARLNPVFAQKKLPDYIPVGYRKGGK